MKYGLLSVLALAVSLLGALSGAPVAHAWAPIQSNANNEVYFYDSWLARMNDTVLNYNTNWFNENWATIKYDDGSTFTVFGNDDTFHFEDAGDGMTMFTGKVCRFYNAMQSTAPGCNPFNNNYSVYTTAVHHIHVTDAWKEKPGSQAGITQYPVYFSNPVDPIDEKPYIKMDTLSKWEASFSDQNFFTIDNVPFTCGDGFPPRITMELWNKETNLLILTDTVSANSKLDYTFPKVTRDVKYEIVAWYSCTDGTPFVEPGASFYSFIIDRNGSLAVVPELESCVTDSYPFVHFDGCIANLKVVTDALSFGTINVGASDGQWSFTDGCHQLGTVGDWINIQNRSVCPAMPSGVRNVITPFITFALGLMTVRFISRQGGNSI